MQTMEIGFPQRYFGQVVFFLPWRLLLSGDAAALEKTIIFGEYFLLTGMILFLVFFITFITFVFWGCCYISTGGDEKNIRAYATYPDEVQAYMRNIPGLKEQIEKAYLIESPNPFRTFLANAVLFLAVLFLLGGKRPEICETQRVYNLEKLQGVPYFETAKEQIPEIDGRWKQLNGVLKIGKDFLLKNREGFMRFLCEGGTEIFHAFLSGALETVLRQEEWKRMKMRCGKVENYIRNIRKSAA